MFATKLIKLNDNYLLCVNNIQHPGKGLKENENFFIGRDKIVIFHCCCKLYTTSIFAVPRIYCRVGNIYAALEGFILMACRPNIMVCMCLLVFLFPSFPVSSTNFLYFVYKITCITSFSFYLCLNIIEFPVNRF